MEHILSAAGQMVVEKGGKMVAGYMGFDESLETLKAKQVEQMEKGFKTFSESIPVGGSIMEKAQKATKIQHLERMAEGVEKLRDEGRMMITLALNTVAASMRGENDDHIWRNAIKNFQNASLQMEDLENNVFEKLKFSYNRLNDQRLKECFLYCCLYPEDYQIKKDEIIIKFIAEGLCGDIDEGHSILKKLVDVFLLEEEEEFVKMHDLMREMALKISKFLVKSELVEIPEEKHWTAELEKVSLNSNALKEIPYDFSPICHKLSTLNLRNSYGWKNGIKEIPESFLLYMSHLRVLDLSKNNELKCLPNSISNLENLCGLFLQGCEDISCLPALKKLRVLRVLNIEGCVGIRELPQDMECLVSLQYLYMRGTNTHLEIPKGVISKLRNLKCIQSDNCRRLQSEDLNCLEDLQEFWSCFDELQQLQQFVAINNAEPSRIIPSTKPREEKSPNQHNIFRAYDNMFGKVCKLTIDDGNCYNINTKVLDWHLGLEIETQPKLYMEVDKSCECIVRWVVIGPDVYPKQPMSAHEF
nr:probable disease resistance protein At1g12290 isoform X2 [Ipomoea batatas]